MPAWTTGSWKGRLPVYWCQGGHAAPPLRLQALAIGLLANWYGVNLHDKPRLSWREGRKYYVGWI